jgi:hypothetical protein
MLCKSGTIRTTIMTFHCDREIIGRRSYPNVAETQSNQGFTGFGIPIYKTVLEDSSPSTPVTSQKSEFQTEDRNHRLGARVFSLFGIQMYCKSMSIMVVHVEVIIISAVLNLRIEPEIKADAEDLYFLLRFDHHR